MKDSQKVEVEEINELKSYTGEGKNKIEKRISVEQIENGFIISESKEWQDEKKGYQYECKKYYSEKNPLSASNQMMTSIKKNLPGT